MRNPSDPINRAFVKIPGNIDLAVRGNILYADLGVDLVAIDIANPDDIELKKSCQVYFHNKYISIREW